MVLKDDESDKSPASQVSTATLFDFAARGLDAPGALRPLSVFLGKVCPGGKGLSWWERSVLVGTWCCISELGRQEGRLVAH